MNLRLQPGDSGASLDVADLRESDVRLPSGMAHGELRAFLGQDDTGTREPDSKPR